MKKHDPVLWIVEGMSWAIIAILVGLIVSGAMHCLRP